MKNEDVQDIAKLLQIKNEFLMRNRNLVYGLIRFLIGPILAFLVAQDSIKKIVQYDLAYAGTYIIVWVVFAYLSFSLIFDITTYVKPFPVVKLSSKQRKLLDWPEDYPSNLIEEPKTSVIEDELQKVRAQKEGTTSVPQTPQTPKGPSQPATPAPTPASSTTTTQTAPSPFAPTIPTTPMPSTPATPQGLQSFFSHFSRNSTPVAAPQTPAPATPAPFSLSTPSAYPQTNTPIQVAYPPASPYPYGSPQVSFSSPQQSFQATPQATPYPYSAQPAASPAPFASPHVTFAPSPFTNNTPLTSQSPHFTGTPFSASQIASYPMTPASPLAVPMATSPVTAPSPQPVISPAATSTRKVKFALGASEINTEYSLKRYMESVKASMDKKVQTPASIRQYFSPPVPPLPKYKPSYNGPANPSSPTPMSIPYAPPIIDNVQQQVFEEDVYTYQINAEKAMYENGLSGLIDGNVERMRHWLGARLIPFVTVFVDLYLNRTDPANSQQWQTFLPHVQAYLDLSGYGFTQPNCADYVAKRIKELNSDSVLAKYNWNRGTETDANNIVWDSRYPCDAVLIAHLFCTYLDFRLVEDPTVVRAGKPFSGKYFARTAFVGKNPNTVIYQRYSYPPHFELVLPDTKMWPMQQGYNNLFHTLSCFVHTIVKDCNGYLGPISIADPEMKLSWVVED